jgi:hypothetical protein
MKYLPVEHKIKNEIPAKSPDESGFRKEHSTCGDEKIECGDEKVDAG